MCIRNKITLAVMSTAVNILKVNAVLLCTTPFKEAIQKERLHCHLSLILLRIRVPEMRISNLTSLI